MPVAVEVLGVSSVVDERIVVEPEASTVGVVKLFVPPIAFGRVVLESETYIVVKESVVSLVVKGRVVVVSETSVAVKALSVLVVVAEVPVAEQTIEVISLSGRASVEDTIEVAVEAASDIELVAPKEISVSVWLDSGLQEPAATPETPTAKHRRAADTLETYMMTKVLMMRRQDLGFFIRRVLGSR